MARQRSPARDEAKKLYLDSKGTIKLIDIAAKLNTKDSQIRKWKSQDKWDDELDTKSKGALPKSNSNVTNGNLTKKEPIADEVKEVLENTELNDKQRLFCVIYAKRMNATKAYQQVYRCTYETAMVEGCRLLRNPKIRKQIDRLMEPELNKEFLKKGLIQQYKDIAFSNIGDYLEFGKKKVPQWIKDEDGVDIPVIDPDTGEQKIKEYSYVDLKDSIGVDTSLITEVSEGKDGIRFKLADKMKAMDVLAKLSNLLSDEEKIKLELEYKSLQNVRTKVEIDRIKAEVNRITDNDELEVEDDGFLDALKGRTAEVWKNE